MDVITQSEAVTVYYIGFYSLLYIGVIIIQTNHLAMIPELCSSADSRARLIAIRNSMTALSNIVGFLIALLVFSFGE